MKQILTLVLTALAVSINVQVLALDAKKGSVDAKLAELENKAEKIAKVSDKRAEVEQRPEVLKKTGGFVDVAAKGTSVLVVDARRKAGGAPDQFGDIFTNLSKTNVKVEKAPLGQGVCPVTMIKERRAAAKAIFAIAVVEDAKIPGLTVLPEERVVVVNAAKYREGEDPVRREERIHKELWRGLGFVAGIGYAPFKNDVLQPVFSVAELDSLEYQVMQPMNFQKMYATLANSGVTRARHIPYRLAVMEGWAAAPTNEYQKTVWDQVHAMPTAPLKINPETRKVAE